MQDDRGPRSLQTTPRRTPGRAVERGSRALNYHHRRPGHGGIEREALAGLRGQWFANLPNLISVGRLVFVPLIIAFIVEGRWAAVFLLFAAAGLSDAVDGFIAKRFALTSELGAYLDPLADKALLISIFVALAVVGVLPAWLAIVVVSRDVMIVGAVLVATLLGRPMPIRPLAISKVNTTVQIVFAGAVLAARAFGLHLGLVFSLAVWLVAALTVASAAAYLARWLDHMSR